MKRPSLGGAPIFLQVLGLALLSVVAAQVINLAVVLTLPDPPPRGFSVTEAARALRGEAVTARDGKRLVVRVQDQAPDLGPPPPAGERGLEDILEASLARELGAPVDRVRAAVVPDFRMRAGPGAEMHRKHFDSHMQVTVTARRSSETIIMRRSGAGRAQIPPEVLDAGSPGMMILRDNLVFPPFLAGFHRPDGKWVVLEPPRPLLSPWQVRMLIWFGLSALLLTPLAWWTARRLARPIHTFASAAERLGRDPNAPPLAHEGPAEVRTAVAAFNDMQEKLRRYVEERTAMVAAIAHDLRTPLTRLRFRVEAAPEEIRAKTAQDIEQMDSMISAALAFARGDAAAAPHVKLDLSALVASTVDDLAETGSNAAFEGGKAVLVRGDALGLRRLIANLVDNAVKFGGAARVSLGKQGKEAVLAIEDDGPGLAPEELERVFQPFYRADPSRNAAVGGFGLGLSTARSIARAHGGDVSLENRSEGGLRATVRLPLA